MPIYKLNDKEPILPKEGEFWVAPDANVIGDILMHKNSSVWFSSTLRGDCERITIGENSNVQDGSVLHTDIGFPLNIGKNVTVGHQVMLHGCEIGDNSLIGIGAVVLNGAKIGRNCLIGSKTLIGEKKEIPDNSMVIGIPGKVIKTIDSDMEIFLKASADHYCENWKNFNQNLKLIK
ncbi:MAG: gamma carbonic anhydrase family protein [Pseudomonadota bacterium]|nr:gamma carbonic anhydrase family protein [Pseudomonadota bacterium]MEC9414735.1 gamma carbonic anhydrase family protein [Pseudomonadota bacterium]